MNKLLTGQGLSLFFRLKEANIKESDMKILYIITQGELGGAQRYVFELATEFAVGNNIIVANGTQGDQWLLENLNGATIKRQQFRNLVREIKFGQDLHAFFEIKKCIKEVRPDLIHVSSTKAGVLVAFAKGATPSIYTVHGWVFNEPMNWFKKQFYIFIEKLACARHNKVVVLGEHDKQIALKKKIVSAKKLLVIPHGIRNSEQQAASGKGQGGKINIVTIANFYKTKGLKYLIDAMKQLAKVVPNLHLTIFGDGPERSFLETQIENHPAITLAGRVSNAENRLHNFDIFVLPSLKEGFPFVILEAMNAKVPIVATTVGEIPTILQNEKTGLLVKPAHSKLLAETILKLVKNPELRFSLAAAAKERVADFSLTEMFQHYHHLYGELVSRNK